MWTEKEQMLSVYILTESLTTCISKISTGPFNFQALITP